MYSMSVREKKVSQLIACQYEDECVLLDKFLSAILEKCMEKWIVVILGSLFVLQALLYMSHNNIRMLQNRWPLEFDWPFVYLNVSCMMIILFWSAIFNNKRNVAIQTRQNGRPTQEPFFPFFFALCTVMSPAETCFVLWFHGNTYVFISNVCTQV